MYVYVHVCWYVCVYVYVCIFAIWIIHTHNTEGYTEKELSERVWMR